MPDVPHSLSSRRYNTDYTLDADPSSSCSTFGHILFSVVSAAASLFLVSRVMRDTQNFVYTSRSYQSALDHEKDLQSKEIGHMLQLTAPPPSSYSLTHSFLHAPYVPTYKSSYHRLRMQACKVLLACVFLASPSNAPYATAVAWAVLALNAACHFLLLPYVPHATDALLKRICRASERANEKAGEGAKRVNGRERRARGLSGPKRS